MLRFEFPRVVTTTMAVPFVLENVIVPPRCSRGSRHSIRHLNENRSQVGEGRTLLYSLLDESNAMVCRGVTR